MSDPVAEQAALLATFLDALARVKARNLPMVELRPRAKTLPEVLEGDYDFVTALPHVPQILAAFLDACQANGTHLEFNGDFRNKRVLRIRSGLQAIGVELWIRIEMSEGGPAGSYLELDGGPLIAALVAGGGAEGHGPAAALLAAIYVTHLVHKQKDISAPLQKERIAAFLAAISGDGASDETAALRDVLREMAEGRLDRAGANRAALAFLSRQGLNAAPRRLQRRIERLQRSLWSLSDRIVPVLGPDGSGKSYFCSNLLEQADGRLVHLPYKQLFRNSKDYWLLLRLFDPRRTRPVNEVDENLSAYIVPKTILTGSLLGRRMRKASKLALIDRYAWDYLFRNLRNTGQVPGHVRLFGSLLAMTPRPDKVIIMACSPDAILARKQELDRERIDFLYREYVALVAGGHARRALFFNSALPFEGSIPLGFVTGR